MVKKNSRISSHDKKDEERQGIVKISLQWQRKSVIIYEMSL